MLLLFMHFTTSSTLANKHTQSTHVLRRQARKTVLVIVSVFVVVVVVSVISGHCRGRVKNTTPNTSKARLMAAKPFLSISSFPRRGFGFITFGDPSSVDKVLAQGTHELDGKKVRTTGQLYRPVHNTCDDFCHSIYPPHQIDPKVAFPRRAHPKVCEPASK